METMLEADRLIKPDTHTGRCISSFEFRFRPADRRPADEFLTSGLPQRTSAPFFFTDFPMPKGVKDFGRLERSHPQGRVFLVALINPQHGPQHVIRVSEDPRSSEALATQHRAHREYLKRVSTERTPPLITTATAKKSWDLWLAVRKAIGHAMPVPSAATGPDGSMFYSWDKGAHHLEAEIFPNRATEFFYRNRETGELWGEDYTAGDPLSAAVLEKLRLFV